MTFQPDRGSGSCHCSLDCCPGRRRKTRETPDAVFSNPQAGPTAPDTGDKVGTSAQHAPTSHPEATWMTAKEIAAAILSLGKEAGSCSTDGGANPGVAPKTLSPSVEPDTLDDKLFKPFVYIKTLIFGIAAGLLLGVVVPTKWEYNQGSDLPYLSSEGLAAAAWGVFFLALAIGMPCMAWVDDRSFRTPNLQRMPPQFPSTHGFGELELTKTCSCSWHRYALLSWTCVRIVVNACFHTYTFLNLPPRDPAEPANTWKHIAAWFEFPCVCWRLLAVLYFSMAYCQKESRAGSGVDLARSLKAAASFSLFQFIGSVRPAKLREMFRSEQHARGTRRAFGLVLLHVTIDVPFAVMALIGKLNSLDFVSMSLVSNWKLSDCVTFVGFVNNIAGIVDPDAEVKAIFMYFDWYGYDVLLRDWLVELEDILIDANTSLLGTLSVLSSLHAEDVCQLLNERNRRSSKSKQF